MLKKNLDEKNFNKNLEKKILNKKNACKECGHFIEVGSKIIFFSFGFVTQNRALYMMKLVKIFFFH